MGEITRQFDLVLEINTAVRLGSLALQSSTILTHEGIFLQACTQTVSGHTFHIFDPVTVQISLDSTNVQHQKLKLELISPKVS